MPKRSFDKGQSGSRLRLQNIEEKFPHVVNELRRRGYGDPTIEELAPKIIARQISWRVEQGPFPTVDDYLRQQGLVT